MINNKLYKQNKQNYENLLRLYEKRHKEGVYGTPLIMSFLITNRCNLKCKHCFYHETLEVHTPHNPYDKEMTIDEYEKISQSMDWFLTGIFCGGEPFIREDYGEIINIFQKNNKIAVADTATNGQFTDAIVKQTEKILQNSKYQNYTLGLSIEGFEEHNDEIRGKGTFKKAMETWRELKKIQAIYKNFEPYICTTMNTINQYDMHVFLKWCMKELEPSKISLLKIRQDPRDGSYLKDVHPRNYEKCIKLIDDYIEQGLMGDINKPQTYLLSSCYKCILESMYKKQRQFHCYAGKHGGFIDYNGNVGVCEIMDIIGNIRESDYDFQKIWNSIKAYDVRSLVCLDNRCNGCTHESEGLLPSISFAPNSINQSEKTL